MVSFICSTREPKESFKEHVIKMCGLDKKKVEFIFYTNNGEFSLSELYNKGLSESKYDINVFLHDDIILETKQVGAKIIKHFDKNPEYGIIGVAGTRKLISGQWWESRKHMMGIVNHEKDSKKWESKYSNNIGDNINESIVLDGVFLAVHKKRIKETFDERFDGFHFYDISFCFRNYLSGVKLGVITNIRLTHKSIGVTNNQWLVNKNKFEEIYSSNLPVHIKKTTDNGEKLKVLIGCSNISDNSINSLTIIDTVKNLDKSKYDISICSRFDPGIKSKLRDYNISFYDIKEPPYFKLGDGIWKLNDGSISIKGNLYQVSNSMIDIVIINGKEIIDYLSKLYKEVDFIQCIASINDELSFNSAIKKYIVMNEKLKLLLINSYEIDHELISVFTSSEDINNMIKSII